MAKLEVFAVPVEDLRDLELAGGRVPAVAAAVGQEALRLFVELRIEPLRDVGLFTQPSKRTL